MSYLGPLRLHFAGQFQAAVSTINNEPEHFDNKRFKAKYQEEPWNPRGDGNWRLIGCEVRSAFMADGAAVAGPDPILATTVADSDRRPPAKLVDLDPWQQMVSTVWGLEMRIADSSGETLVRGQFEPAPFFGLLAAGLLRSATGQPTVRRHVPVGPDRCQLGRYRRLALPPGPA
jgi:hypothetical protein